MKKHHINLVFEDILSEAVLKSILRQVDKDFEVGRCFPDLKRDKASPGFSYIKKNIKGFNHAAKGTPFLVLTDLDTAECAPILVKEWLPFPKHHNLIFRVAVREVEAWVLADRESFANFLSIEQKLIPTDVDNDVEDPKKFLVRLAKRSRRKDIKDALVPRSGSTALVGPGYNPVLITFVRDRWRLKEAVEHSDSLKRAFIVLKNF